MSLWIQTKAQFRCLPLHEAEDEEAEDEVAEAEAEVRVLHRRLRLSQKYRFGTKL